MLCPVQNHVVLDAQTSFSNSQAGLNGGGISIVSSLTSALPQIIDVTGSQIAGSTAIAGTGGFAKIIGNDVQANIITGAQISASESGSHAGVIHFAVAG